MRTEIQYRTFDELLDSVKIDLPTQDLEDMIEPQQLIKVAMRVNYDLGLKVNPSRSKSLEVYKGKAKLPLDFYVLNFALVCQSRFTNVEPGTKAKTYLEGLLDGAALQGLLGAAQQGTVYQYTVVMDIVTGTNTVTHNLNTEDVLVQAVDDTGNFLSYTIDIISPNQIALHSQAPTVSDVKIIVIGTKNIVPSADGVVTPRPVGGEDKEYYTVGTKQYQPRELVPMRIEKNKSVSAECPNLNSQHPYAAVIKNGFLVCNFQEGEVIINYQSLMEDDDGNLLVMDHPMVNEYYEYAIKQRIYENLVFSGENAANYLQLVEQRLRPARNNALSFVNTPDFREMYKIWQMNRKAQYSKYYDMFKSRFTPYN